MATSEINTLSLHDALAISPQPHEFARTPLFARWATASAPSERRSEEHTSELQSRFELVCRLLLETKKSHRLLVLSSPYLVHFGSVVCSFLTIVCGWPSVDL